MDVCLYFAMFTFFPNSLYINITVGLKYPVLMGPNSRFFLFSHPDEIFVQMLNMLDSTSATHTAYKSHEFKLSTWLGLIDLLLVYIHGFSNCNCVIVDGIWCLYVLTQYL